MHVTFNDSIIALNGVNVNIRGPSIDPSGILVVNFNAFDKLPPT